MPDLRFALSRPRSVLAVLRVLGLVAVLGACAVPGDARPLTLDSPRFGNVFGTDEPVSFHLSGDPGVRVDWRLVDLDRHELAAASLELGRDGRGELALPLDRLGYFELALTASDGTAGTTSFVRLPPAPRRLDPRFGTQTHFAQNWPVEVVPLIARAGIGFVRDEQYWARVERRPGTFGFPDGYRRYMDELAAWKIEPLLEMSFENPNYDDGKTPSSPEAQAAFARYGVELLDRYGAQVRAIEVWNEINGTWCTGACPKDRAGVYAGMLRAAYPALKAARPDVTVVGGAAVLVPLPWFRAIFERGALDWMDAIAIHPYRAVPEGVELEVEALRQLARHYHPGADRPIWATETSGGTDSEASRADNAGYLVRQLTLLLGAGVERMSWYLFFDYGGSTGRGLLRAPDSPFGRYAPAPAYAAYANLIQQLGFAKPQGREPAGDLRSQVWRFDRDGQPVRVLWSTQGEGRLTFAAEQPLRLVDLMGNARTLRPEAGRVTLPVTAEPAFLVGAATFAGEDRPDRLLADSLYGFSTIQGQAGWSYGYAVTPDLAFDEFKPFVADEDAWSAYWGRGAGKAYPRISVNRMHPARWQDQNLPAVLRWTSDHAGPVTLVGSFSLSDKKSDGVTVAVMVDGRPLQRQDIAKPGAPVTFELPAELHAGSTVDLVVAPGPGGGANNDMTAVSLKILAPRGP